MESPFRMDVSVNEILDNSVPFERIPIIYFLIRDKQVVYVGQSKVGLSRIDAHKYDKEFDSYYYINCDEDYLSDCEATYIARFMPQYNSSLPQNTIFKTIKYLKDKYNLSSWDARKLVKNHKLKAYFDGTYYIEHFFRKALMKEEGVSNE